MRGPRIAYVEEYTSVMRLLYDAAMQAGRCMHAGDVAAGWKALRRREVLAVLAAALRGQWDASAQAQGTRPLLLLRASDVVLVRRALADAGGPQADARLPLAKERARLVADAEAALGKGPWSVTTERPKDTPTEKNDFFSEGPYWWPDPAKPGGAYVRRDGEVNPDRFTRNDQDLRELSETVLCLATAAVLLEEPRYAQRAWKLMQVWFVDKDTRMNPNLEFGQAIRGLLWGRGIGLIDTTPLIWLAQGILLLESADSVGVD
ncbi:MAG: alginate lyase family protein, partial [Bryobacterales bacterium]|nr:alginate lyase family protein [Bryobacterales bacterium]